MHAESTERRKYALTKLAPGDYIFPSNDRDTIWRVSRYVDGPSMGRDDWPRDRPVWGTWRWVGRGIPQTVEDIDDWGLWELEYGSSDTRAEAIADALGDRS